MSIHKRTATVVVARQMHPYKTGDRVKVLRGRLAGQICEVRDSANNWVVLKGTPVRDVMSKGNVEPEAGLTEDEMNQARRVSEKMRGLGSLV